MIYEISAEGANGMRQLASDLVRFSSDLTQAAQALSGTVRANEEGLGIYADSILELVANLGSSREGASDAMLLLASKAREKAEAIDAFVAAGLGA